MYLGSEETRFLVHRGILAQSPSLASTCKRSGEIETLRLPEVQPRLFVLLLAYLYKGDYGTTSSAESVVKEPGNDAAAQFKTHAKVYCLASAYKLDRLVEKTITKMKALSGIGFRSLVEIAREVYPNTQADDIWFKNYFKNEVTRALTETPDIAEDQCILEIYKHDGGRLAVDLFTTIIQFVNHGAKVDGTVAGPGALQPVPDSDNVRCEKRAQHLRSLKKNGPWRGCQACHRERDQMIDVGHTVVSVAINDLLSSINSGRAVDQFKNATAEPSIKTKKRKAKKALRTLASEIIPPILLAQTTEDSTSQCPNQAEHLKKVGSNWGWEECPRCLEDRAQILHKLQLLDPSPSLSVLSNLIQQWQETPISLHPDDTIVPDATSQEIAPVKVGLSKGDAPPVNASEIDPTVIESSLVSALPDAIPEFSVSFPIQETNPINIDAPVVNVSQPEIPAISTLDDIASSIDERKYDSSRAPRMALDEVVTEPTPIVDIPKKEANIEQEQYIDGTWGRLEKKMKKKNQRQSAFGWESFGTLKDEVPPAEEQEQTKDDEWGAFPLGASPPNPPYRPSKQPGTRALHTDDSWGSQAFKKTQNKSSWSTFDPPQDPSCKPAFSDDSCDFENPLNRDSVLQEPEPGETSLELSRPAEDSVRPEIWFKDPEVPLDNLGFWGRKKDRSKADKLEQPKDVSWDSWGNSKTKSTADEPEQPKNFSWDFWGNSKNNSTADEPEQPKNDPWASSKKKKSVPTKDDAYVSGSEP